MRRRSAARRIVNVDRIRAASDGIVEHAPLEDIGARKRVFADDSPRFAHPDLRCSGSNARVREARDAPAKERHNPHRLCACFDLGPRQIVGIERVDVDDARHVHRDFHGG